MGQRLIETSVGCWGPSARHRLDRGVGIKHAAGINRSTFAMLTSTLLIPTNRLSSERIPRRQSLGNSKHCRS